MASTGETMKRLDTENRLHFTKNGGIRQKRYLDDRTARAYAVQDVITDIFPINSQAKERFLGYPKHKSRSLLERIIQRVVE